jgi:hypothetical protein
MSNSVVSTTVEVNSKGAEKSVGEIKNKLKEARNELANAIENFGEFSEEAKKASQQVEGLSKELEDVPKTVASIKARLREARTELTNAIENFGEFSIEAVTAAKKVEELKGTIDDASRLVSAFDGDRKFQAFGQSIGAVASGFTAAQGAIGLFGAESAEVEQALLKVNSAMALSQGINGVLEGVKSFKDLGNQIKGTTVFQKASTAATVAATTVQKLFSKSVDQGSTSFKGLRGAIIATGIGALVVVLGLVINNFDSIKKAVLNLIPGLKAVGDFVGKLVTGFTDFIGLTSEAERETERLKKATDKNNEALENQIEIMQAQGKTSKEIRAVKNKMYEDELNNIRAVLAAQGSLSEEEAARFRELKQQQAVLAAEGVKEAEDAAKVAARKAAETAKKASDAAAAERKRLKEAKAAEDKKNQEEEAKKLAEFRLKRINDAKEFTRAERDKDKQDFEKQTEENEKRLLDRVSRDIAIRAKDSEDKAKKFDNDKALTDALAANQVEADKVRVASIQSVSNALGVASDIIGKETAAGKALAVAQALINTYLGASEVIKAKSVLPEPFGTISKIANVAAIIATGIKSVKAITSVKVPGRSAGGGGANIPSSPVTAPVAPQADTTRLDPTQVNQIGNAASRAYVVESDITGNQDKIKRLNRQARIS